VLIGRGEERLSLEHLEQDEPEREDVDARVDVLAHQTLGGGVREHRRRYGGSSSLEVCAAEGCEHRMRRDRRTDQHRGGCEVAVNHAPLVRVGEGVGQLLGDAEGVGRRERAPLAEHVVEQLGVHPLFHHVLLAPLPREPEDRHDVVVPQLAGQLNPPLDGRALLGIVGDLIGPEPEGDDRAAPLVAHLVGRPGGALAVLLDYLVLAGDESPHASPPLARARGASTPDGRLVRCLSALHGEKCVGFEDAAM